MNTATRLRVLAAGIGLNLGFLPEVSTAATPEPPTLELPAPPLELVTNEDHFRPFARAAAALVERLLAEPAAVDDAATLRLLLALRVHLAHHFGDDDRAIATAAWIRSLQPDPAEKAFAGLTTLAAVAARRETGAPPESPAYQAVFERTFAAGLASLPHTTAIRAMLQRQQEKNLALTRDGLLAETRRGLVPALAGRATCTLAEADQLVRVRHRLVSILPVRAATLRALETAIKERSVP
jgi:hypothetical protein